jgi:hypothetical protein
MRSVPGIDLGTQHLKAHSESIAPDHLFIAHTDAMDAVENLINDHRLGPA